VFDTIANAFDDSRKEIGDELHGKSLPNQKDPGAWKGPTIATWEKLGRKSLNGQSQLEAEVRRERNLDFGIPSLPIFLDK